MNHATLGISLAAFLAIAGAAAPAAAQGSLDLFLADPGGVGAVAPFAEGTGAALAADPELEALRLLPLDFNGRLAVDELLPDRPRYEGDLGLAGRIRLQGSNGVLYRHERVRDGLPNLFGFLLVEPSGVIRRLAELPGTGAAGDADPWLERVGIAPDGGAFLAATTPAAGGDLFEIDVATGLAEDRTAHLPPLEFRKQSLLLASDWGIAVCSRAVLRTGRLAGDLARVVPIGGSAAHHTGEVVLSPSGTVALTTAGRGPLELFAWVFGPAGPASRASRTAAQISGAGFLPEAPHGPFLAVADDGVLCAWRAKVGVSHELFLRRTDFTAATPATQVTADALYTDTLEEIGVLQVGAGGADFAVGEPGGEPGVGIEGADFFRASLSPDGTLQVENATGTSGELTPPFQSIPTLTPMVRRQLEPGGAYLMHDEAGGGGGRLISVTPGVPGFAVQLDDVKQVDFVERVGDTIVCSLRRASGSKPHQLVVLPSDLSAAPTVVMDAGDASLLQPVAHPTDWIAFVERPEVGNRKLHRLHLPSLAIETSVIEPAAFHLVMGLSPSLDLVFAFDAAGLRRFVGWPSGGGAMYRLDVATTTGTFLPGR